MNQESKIWLKNKTNTNMALELEKLFKSNFLIIPGAHDAISALLAVTTFLPLKNFNGFLFDSVVFALI